MAFPPKGRSPPAGKASKAEEFQFSFALPPGEHVDSCGGEKTVLY
jgi:hypothetical protein